MQASTHLNGRWLPRIDHAGAGPSCNESREASRSRPGGATREGERDERVTGFERWPLDDRRSEYSLEAGDRPVVRRLDERYEEQRRSYSRPPHPQYDNRQNDYRWYDDRRVEERRPTLDPLDDRRYDGHRHARAAAAYERYENRY